LCLCALAAGRATGQDRPVMGRVPVEQISPALRERVHLTVEHPTLSAHGPVEAFTCKPATYYWLLDHPDLTAQLWRQLGAKVADVTSLGDGRFGWSDGQGSSLHWETALRTPQQRIWYAEGRVKPGMLLPTTAIKAVMVINYTEGQDKLGHPALRHQVQLFLRTDSMAVAMAARVVGMSAPHMAEQYLGQIETFFAAMSWYLNENPRQARALCEKAGVTIPEDGESPR
jgi:hypothetical protein